MQTLSYAFACPSCYMSVSDVSTELEFYGSVVFEGCRAFLAWCQEHILLSTVPGWEIGCPCPCRAHPSAAGQADGCMYCADPATARADGVTLRAQFGKPSACGHAECLPDGHLSPCAAAGVPSMAPCVVTWTPEGRRLPAECVLSRCENSTPSCSQGRARAPWERPLGLFGNGLLARHSRCPSSLVGRRRRSAGGVRKKSESECRGRRRSAGERRRSGCGGRRRSGGGWRRSGCGWSSRSKQGRPLPCVPHVCVWAAALGWT